MKKNGKLELYRFVFSIAILLYHAEKYLVGEPQYSGIHFGLFSHGSIGVEFFFMLSGFFLARTALKNHCLLGDKPLLSRESSSDTVRYILKKYLRFFPEHMVAFLLTLTIYLVRGQLRPAASVFYIFDNFFSFFLLQMGGLMYQSANHVEWYLSAMLISMTVIYPLCRRYYYGFTRCLAPLLSVLIYGALFYTTGSLTTVGKWTVFGFKGLIRAFAGIMLGTVAYEITRMLSAKRISDKAVRAMGILEAACFLMLLVFMVSRLAKKYEFHAAALVFLLLVCAASGVRGPAELNCSRISGFLGEFSFSIYLSQIPAYHLVLMFMRSSPISMQVIAGVLITFALSWFVRLVGGLLDRRFFAQLRASL